MAHYRWARISTSWLPDEIARRRGDRTLRRTSVHGSKPAWLAFRGSASKAANPASTRHSRKAVLTQSKHRALFSNSSQAGCSQRR